MVTMRDVRALQQSLNDADFKKQNDDRLRRARLVEKRAEEDRKLDEEAKKQQNQPKPAQASATASKAPTATSSKTDDKQPTPAQKT